MALFATLKREEFPPTWIVLVNLPLRWLVKSKHRVSPVWASESFLVPPLTPPGWLQTGPSQVSGALGRSLHPPPHPPRCSRASSPGCPSHPLGQQGADGTHGPAAVTRRLPGRGWAPECEPKVPRLRSSPGFGESGQGEWRDFLRHV